MDIPNYAAQTTDDSYALMPTYSETKSDIQSDPDAQSYFVTQDIDAFMKNNENCYICSIACSTTQKDKYVYGVVISFILTNNKSILQKMIRKGYPPT